HALTLSSEAFSFSLPRPPPSSTLFPYTTLFRSLELRGGVLMPTQRLWVPVAILLVAAGCRDAAAPAVANSELSWTSTAVTPSSLDRKSTRLNSSHVSISYAVFCLKKKKPHDQQIALAMLAQLRCRDHRVLTGLCIRPVLLPLSPHEVRR